MWISLCKTRYKAGFCCVMQQTVYFSLICYCSPRETPYNAPPLNGITDVVQQSKKQFDSEAGKRNIRSPCCRKFSPYNTAL
ncbi:hypothetical protein CRN84_05020 [Budvicia aquatica]|uniref:Uncharacterized protein n=1 Tax=Budvicia aquatica TaxID=82979 RepID=A0A2C6DJW6_9GAMM|nr:hypothetical protein CRN84_05020 [Budvicia aquatica]